MTNEHSTTGTSQSAGRKGSGIAFVSFICGLFGAGAVAVVYLVYYGFIGLHSEGLMIAGLACGISGGIVAVVLGHVARSARKAGRITPATPKAMFGLVTGYLALLASGVFFFQAELARYQAGRSACLSMLVAGLRGAMEQYALENRKETGDPVTFADLVGSDKYLKVMPFCPRSGQYRLFRLGQFPACTELAHTLAAYAARVPGFQEIGPYYESAMVQVLDQTGQPLAGAQLLLTNRLGKLGPFKTSAEGTIKWRNIRLPGTNWFDGLTIVARKPGYADASLLWPYEGEKWPVKLVLKEAAKP